MKNKNQRKISLIFLFFSKKVLTNLSLSAIILSVVDIREFSSAGRASALQAEGHRFEPCNSHQYGLVVQLVRTLACHARGRGFDPHPGRHFFSCPLFSLGKTNAFVAQLVEQRTENPRVVGSIPTEGTICGFSSFGRAPPCQGGGSEFEPRNPLQMAT